jgi:superfamily II DNA or RNA helicase
MPKAVISNRIYMDAPENKKELFDKLTYRIVTGEGNVRYEKVETIRNYRMVTPSIISIPQGRQDLIPEGYEIVDKRIEHWEDFPEPKHQLFPEQQVVYDEVEDSCFINALVGWGKTFTALHIAGKLGQKTLVVTHTADLRDQWIEEVKELYGIEPGVIGGGIYNVNAPIIIGNIQSLVKRKEEISKMFGTLIMDEGHHVPASTFTELIDSSHARYRIGLSGTMQRKDGRHVMFSDFFGSTVYKPPQNNTIAPLVRLLKTGQKLPGGKTWQDIVTKLLSDEEYIDLIASIALIQARKGHKVLIIASRVSFLQKVAGLLGERATVVIGDTTDRKGEVDKILNGECDILCGSRQIFSEGISVNPLSCVILAEPLANAPTLEQIIGRIMRLSPNKLKPLVIDMQFSGGASMRQNSIRVNFYISKGWEIEAL